MKEAMLGKTITVIKKTVCYDTVVGKVVISNIAGDGYAPSKIEGYFVKFESVKVNINWSRQVRDDGLRNEEAPKIERYLVMKFKAYIIDTLDIESERME
jgi:hypothetical protein